MQLKQKSTQPSGPSRLPILFRQASKTGTGLLQGKHKARQEVGFKGRALLPRHLRKDPPLLVSMPVRVPEMPVLTHSQNLLFPPSKQEFKPETHLGLPRSEATPSRTRLSPQPPARLSRATAPHRRLCPPERKRATHLLPQPRRSQEPHLHKNPAKRPHLPLSRSLGESRSEGPDQPSRVAWPQPLRQLPSVPTTMPGDAAGCQHHPSTTPHHPADPRALRPWLNNSHYARFSRCPYECLHLFGVAGTSLLPYRSCRSGSWGKAEMLCQRCQPASCSTSLQPAVTAAAALSSNGAAAPRAQHHALWPQGRGRGGRSHPLACREDIKP